MAVRKRRKAKQTTRKRKTPKRKATRKTTRKKTSRKKPAKKRKASGLMKMNYHLSASLATVCGTKKCSRPQVMKKVWAYIKKNKLQDNQNRRMINPDQKLGSVLGDRPINMLKMAGALSKHLKQA